MDDTSFCLDQQTYAKLSREDLESLGKQAAVAYISSDISLNDVIIKLARQHPSISSHQIRRVAEFANQETFSRLFADNEKYASDKNIEFDVADPGEILQTLNIQASPEHIHTSDSSYHSDPVKTASVVNALEDDIALARDFGFDVSSPGSERTVSHLIEIEKTAAQYTDRILNTRVKEATPADRILESEEEGISGNSASALTQDMVPDIARQDTADESAIKEGMGGPEAMMMNAQPSQHPELTHRENMRGMERRVELEKKKQELMAMQSKSVQAPGDMGGAPQPPMGQQQAPMGPPQGGMPVQGAPSPIPPDVGPSMPQIKQSSVIDEALSYARMGRVKTAAVVEDLRQSVSLDKIKEAARNRGQYPESNPFGELYRMKQKLARVHEEAVGARNKNEYMMKEAELRFFNTITQHIFEGGNLGEITHAMQSVPGNDNVISSMMTKAAEHLISKGLDPDELRAEMIPYEMEKSAHTRQVNPDHPVADAFGSYCKMAESHKILKESASSLAEKLQETEDVLTQAFRSQHAQSA